MISRHLYYLAILLLLCHISFAQISWKFRHINTQDGLSTGTINCVFKDSKGYIWIGTVDGLNRYDGYNCEVFKNEENNSNSIAGNIITAINEDESGNIWIGTRNNGVSIYNWTSNSFRDFTQKDLPSTPVRDIKVTNNKKVLIATLGGGIYVFNSNDSSTTNYSFKTKNISNDFVFELLRDNNNKYWVSSQAGAIDLLDVGTGKSQVYR